MDKSVKRECKDMRKNAKKLGGTYRQEQSKHLKVWMEIPNDFGELIYIKQTMPVSPSDTNWMKQHRRNLRKLIKQNHITGYRI